MSKGGRYGVTSAGMRMLAGIDADSPEDYFKSKAGVGWNGLDLEEPIALVREANWWVFFGERFFVQAWAAGRDVQCLCDLSVEEVTVIFKQVQQALEEDRDFPEMFIKSKAGEAIVEAKAERETRVVVEYLSASWSLLPEETKQLLRDRFLERVKQGLAGKGPLEARVREVVLQRVEELAQQYVAEHEAEWRAKVAQAIGSLWNAEVEDVVRRELDGAIARVRETFK